MAPRARQDIIKDGVGDVRLAAKKRRLVEEPKTHGKKWWLQEPSQAAASVFNNVLFWQTNQGYRLRRLRRYARIYGNMPSTSYMSSLNRVDIERQRISKPFSTNVTKSCVDTVAATVSETRPKPYYVTSIGNWRGQQQCRDLNRFLRGVMNECKYGEKLIYQAFDALIGGRGFLYFHETLDRRVGIKRVLSDQVWTDDAESINTHDPRQLCLVELLDREVCRVEHPGYDTVISQAKNPLPSQSDPVMSTADLVTRITAWRLPNGPDDPGKKFVCLSSGALGDLEDYTRTYYPITDVDYSEAPEGYWPSGLVEELEPQQRRLNMLDWAINANIDLAGAYKVFLKNSANLDANHMTNAIGPVLTGDEPPMFLLGAIVQQEVYAWEEKIADRMYQISGVSQAASSGVIPQGVKSGEAQRVYLDAFTKRFIKFARRVENSAVDAAQKIIDIVQDISARGEKPGYEVKAIQINSIESIDWKNLDYKPSIFTVQSFAISALPNDPAGRKEEVMDLFSRGWIDADTAMDLLDIPDLERFESLFRQHRDRIMKSLDRIIMEEKYTDPDDFDNLPLAHVMAMRYLKLAQNQDAPDGRILMLKRYITDVVALQDKAAAAAAAKAQAMQAASNPTPTATATQLSGFNPNVPIPPAQGAP